MKKTKVLFVCVGNICRSPMAEFVFKELVKREGLDNKIIVNSAATTNEEIGSDMHRGTKEELKKHCIPYDKHCARKMTFDDYNEYDYIIGMDDLVINGIFRIIDNDEKKKVHKLMDFTGDYGNIADPWYTGDFKKTYEDVWNGCLALLSYLLSH